MNDSPSQQQQQCSLTARKKKSMHLQQQHAAKGKRRLAHTVHQDRRRKPSLYNRSVSSRLREGDYHKEGTNDQRNPLSETKKRLLNKSKKIAEALRSEKKLTTTTTTALKGTPNAKMTKNNIKMMRTRTPNNTGIKQTVLTPTQSRVATSSTPVNVLSPLTKANLSVHDQLTNSSRKKKLYKSKKKQKQQTERRISDDCGSISATSIDSSSANHPPARTSLESTASIRETTNPRSHENVRVYIRVRPILQHELDVDVNLNSTEFQSSGNGEQKKTDGRHHHNQELPLSSSSSVITVEPADKTVFDKQHDKTNSMTSSKSNAVTANALVVKLAPSTRNKRFTFDGCFGQNSVQNDVYETVGKPIALSLLRRLGHVVGKQQEQTNDNDTVHLENACLMAYGQSGSGKTHTMYGPGGMAERLLNDLQPCYPFEVSLMQIYREKVTDLLIPRNNATSSASSSSVIQSDSFQTLRIREGSDKRVYVEGLSRKMVHSASEALEILDHALRTNRAVGTTNLNSQSSRSHAVFQLWLRHKDLFNPKPVKVYIVDLAGSERQKRSGTSGQSLKEASGINKSLSALGNVIKALTSQSSGSNPSSVAGSTTGSLVTSESLTSKKRQPNQPEPASSSSDCVVLPPYRDSKLTFLLRECLGGVNARTALIATVAPSQMHLRESLSTLLFARRCKFIKNKVIDPNAAAKRRREKLEFTIRQRLLATMVKREDYDAVQLALARNEKRVLYLGTKLFDETRGYEKTGNATRKEDALQRTKQIMLTNEMRRLLKSHNDYFSPRIQKLKSRMGHSDTLNNRDENSFSKSSLNTTDDNKKIVQTILGDVIKKITKKQPSRRRSSVARRLQQQRRQSAQLRRQQLLQQQRRRRSSLEYSMIDDDLPNFDGIEAIDERRESTMISRRRVSEEGIDVKFSLQQREIQEEDCDNSSPTNESTAGYWDEDATNISYDYLREFQNNDDAAKTTSTKTLSSKNRASLGDGEFGNVQMEFSMFQSRVESEIGDDEEEEETELTSSIMQDKGDCKDVNSEKQQKIGEVGVKAENSRMLKEQDSTTTSTTEGTVGGFTSLFSTATSNFIPSGVNLFWMGGNSDSTTVTDKSSSSD
eukprot:g2496.t1